MCYKIKKIRNKKEIHMALEHILAFSKWLMHEWVNMNVWLPHGEHTVRIDIGVYTTNMLILK